MALTQREFEQMAGAVERMSARNGYRIVMPGESLTAREENLLLEELGFTKRPDTDPPRRVKDVSDDILTEFERRRR
jgi:hypothetical protein